MSPKEYEELSDEFLAKLSSQGDLYAFSLLLQRYQRPLLQYILRISHFPAERAEDILQEVFVKIWNNLSEYNDQLKFSSWIYRITHNETISEFRKASARRELQQIDWDVSKIECLPARIDISDDLNKKITAENISKILCMLSPQYRSVLILKFLEDRNYEEISEILGIPTGTVATLLHRAKTVFRNIVNREHSYPCSFS